MIAELIKMHEQQKFNFQETARIEPIIARCVDIGRQYNLPDSWVWLMAATALLEQNRQLMENAQALIATLPPSTFIAEKI